LGYESAAVRQQATIAKQMAEIADEAYAEGRDPDHSDVLDDNTLDR
jgi:hypothetical protein